MSETSMENYQVSSEEAQEVTDIITKYFKKTTGSDMQAKIMTEKLAALVQQPSAKLIHLGNTVFLTLVKEPGVVEIHTMTDSEDSAKLAKNFVKLSNILKSMGVKRAYTYTNDPKLAVVAKRTKLPFKTSKTVGEDGRSYTVYTLEFK
jgi:hypothetical protein